MAAAEKFSFKVAEFLNRDDFDKLSYRQKVGWFGQQIAKQSLKNKGFEVLAENYYVKGGEIDLVMRRDNIVRLIEVKTRTTTSYGQPQEAINFIKMGRLTLAAQKFMFAKGWLGKIPFQLDGLAVFIDKSKGKVYLRHFENLSDF